MDITTVNNKTFRKFLADTREAHPVAGLVYLADEYRDEVDRRRRNRELKALNAERERAGKPRKALITAATDELFSMTNEQLRAHAEMGSASVAPTAERVAAKQAERAERKAAKAAEQVAAEVDEVFPEAGEVPAEVLVARELLAKAAKAAYATAPRGHKKAVKAAIMAFA